MNWSQSFNYHARAGNHEATGRLLELDVWSDSKTRDELRSVRNTQIADLRSALHAELDELAIDIVTIVNAGVCGEGETVSFGHRLERLRNELSQVVDFSAFRRRMNQLQSTILRLRKSGLHSAVIAADSTATSLRSKSIAGELPGSRASVLCSAPQQADFQSFDIFSGE